MSQVTVKEPPQTAKFAGLDQATAPTIPTAVNAFSIRGVVERNNVLQRLPGKVASLKKTDDVFHIHFLPNGSYIIHCYTDGIILVE